MTRTNINKRLTRFFFAIACFLFIGNQVLAQGQLALSTKPKLIYPDLVDRLNLSVDPLLFWVTTSDLYAPLKAEFLHLLDSAAYSGLDKYTYHYDELSKVIDPLDTAASHRMDILLKDGLIAYAKDMYQGAGILKWLKNDEVSPAYAKADNDFLLGKIAGTKTATDLASFIASIEPNDNDYLLLKNELSKNIAANNKHNTDELVACLNLYRWIHHFHFDKYIVVNIPSITLRYYENDSLKLQSKVVVGKVATKSPRFSTFCYQIVLYPYWNVPRDIAVKELIPHFRKSPAALAEMNMQIVADNGAIIDPAGIDWSQMNASNFHYTFRQCTGCDNSLGVIKFNLTDPFDVYLHDTNFKLAFLKDTRFLSHGCIRVEKPLELGNCLLSNSLDSNYLKACYKDQQPRYVNLTKKVPVFVVYMPAEAIGDSVVFYKDVYSLFK